MYIRMSKHKKRVKDLLKRNKYLYDTIEFKDNEIECANFKVMELNDKVYKLNKIIKNNKISNYTDNTRTFNKYVSASQSNALLQCENIDLKSRVKELEKQIEEMEILSC